MTAGADDPPRAARALQRTYGASKEVIAWQVRNASVSLPPDIERYIREQLSRHSGL